MLAYVFWHWKRGDVAADAYEARQRAFHAALAAEPAPGFVRSFSVGLSGAPWAALRGDAYEDWYLVDDFPALGALNDAAVSAGRAVPHDAAARLVDGGAGGLYRLRLGSVVPAPGHAAWFAKPDGMRYEELLAELAPIVEGARGALWMRQMVLGPAREFCLHSGAPVTAPSRLETLVIPLRRAWRDEG